jgi:hypothetical protein
MEQSTYEGVGRAVADALKQQRRELEGQAVARHAQLERQVAGLRTELAELRAVMQALLPEPD